MLARDEVLFYELTSNILVIIFITNIDAFYLKISVQKNVKKCDVYSVSNESIGMLSDCVHEIKYDE